MQGIIANVAKGNDLCYKDSMCRVPVADDSVQILQEAKMAKAVRQFQLPIKEA